VTYRSEQLSIDADQPSVAQPSMAADAPAAAPESRWPLDVVASVAAVLAALAVHTALRLHTNVSAELRIGASLLALGALAWVHIMLRAQAVEAAPMPAVQPKRVRKKRPAPGADRAAPLATPALAFPQDAPVAAPRAAPKADPVVAAQPEPLPRAPEARSAPRAPSRPVAAPSPAAAVSPAVTPAQQPAVRDARVSAVGFEQLQNLVAELARTTPGPKATTPDPDAIRPAALAAEQQSFARALDAANVAQAAALSRAARIMNHDASADRHNPPGIAADLVDALTAERMTVYLEPIQQMETDRPRHYEISVRFKTADGSELPHDALLSAARTAGLLPRVDAAILPRAARIAQHFQLRGRDTDIFARVHGTSLPDQEFRAEVTAAAIAADGGSIILSFAQDDVRGFGRIHWMILSTLAEMGVRFAIESVTDLDMDFGILKRHGFAFVKLDKDVLLDGLPAPGGTIASSDVCRHFASLGLALIVSHIDDEKALARILGFGILFGQGALFGGRRAVRSDLLGAAAA
jgi:EAL domain-containing protein (putative c-di-GMP-specific phosphodiesterase class I)